MKIKKYKFVLVHKATGNFVFANKMTEEQSYYYHRHRARFYFINWLDVRNKDTYTASELTFAIVAFLEKQQKEFLKEKRRWTKLDPTDNLKKYYRSYNLKLIEENKLLLKEWRIKKKEVMNSKEYMFEVLMR